MKNLKVMCAFIVAASLIVACSNKVYVDKAPTANLTNYNTYAWVETQPNQKDKKDTTVTSMEMSIRDMVNQELRSEGWMMSDQNPGVLVSFDIMTDRALVQDTDPAYVSNYSPGFYNPYTTVWTPLTYPSNFVGWDTDYNVVNKATAFITITDASTNNQLWQGYTTVRVGSDGVQTTEIREAVEDVLNKFDPGS